MNPLVSHSPIAVDLQQCRGFEGVKHFDGQDFFAQDSRVSQVRARTFIRLLEQSLILQEKSKPVLGSFLKQVLQLSDSEEDGQRLGEISQAFLKQRGYFSRFFSGESWEEWTENRTPLGKVTSQFRDCIESQTQVDSFTKRLDGEVVRKADEEADALLKGLEHRDAVRGRSFSIESKSSCATGLTLGTFGSLLTRHPLPLLLGFSKCFSKVRAQQKVGSEFQINNYIANDQQFPSVASFPDGNFVVVWQSYGQDGSYDGIYGQLFNENGSKIGSEFQVNTYTNLYQSKPSVASFLSGNFVVTWQSSSQDGSGYGIFGQIFNSSKGSVGSEFQINTYTNSDQTLPAIVSINNANFLVAWESRNQDGSGLGVYGQLFNGTEAKIGNEFRINTFTNGDQDNPSVASLNNNNFVISWEGSNQDYGSSVGVFGQLINESGSKVGSEFQVNNYTRNHQGSPSVTGLDTGNFVVTWYSKFQDGSTVSVFGQLFNESGEKIRSEFRINTFINGSQGSPSVASIKNNHFIVTWQSLDQDGSDWGVFGQLFDENCSKIGNEFPINIYTDLDQSKPAVASLQNNNFVVVWHSNGQDGSGYGIYGQIFHDNITYSSTSSTTSSSKSSKSSSTSRTSKSSIFRSSSGISHEISSSSSPSNKRLLWLWLLLGIGSGATCLGSTVIFFLKSRNKEANGDVLTSELGEIKQTNGSTGEGEGDYQRTPDRVKPEDGRQYGRLSHDSTMEGDYQRTPDHVKPL